MTGSRTIDKIRKRGKWPVKLDDETTVHVRDMLNSEKRTARGIDDPELRGYFMLGIMLLEDDGTQSFIRADGEAPADFAARVMAEMDDVPEAFQLKMLDTLTKASSIPEKPPKKLIEDETALLAARLGIAVGRLDWWNIPDEHTDFQWACQIALDQIQPFGAKRDDMRAARHTANLMVAASHRTEPVSDGEFREMVNTLQSYLPTAEMVEDQDDMEALKLMQQGA